ncbi:hypothetical protein P4O66_005471 [Electrophorus voltai]|uniref:Uncharacterized protein n=1 Tax=Electrophorus voltai TaxID=2609070 RepID=A0AAD8ZLD7_9TELE|nr:hypothetical protein P4O66_005471 [Electrophorus voltai]
MDCSKKQEWHYQPVRINRTMVERVDSFRYFYTCTIESILKGNITVWFGNSTKQERQALQSVVHSANRITHTELPDLQTIYYKWCQTKARRIVKDPTHPNNRLFSLLRTQDRAQSTTGREANTQDRAQSTTGREANTQDRARSTTGREDNTQDRAWSTTGREDNTQDRARSTTGREDNTQDRARSTTGREDNRWCGQVRPDDGRDAEVEKRRLVVCEGGGVVSEGLEPVRQKELKMSNHVPDDQRRTRNTESSAAWSLVSFLANSSNLPSAGRSGTSAGGDMDYACAQEKDELKVLVACLTQIPLPKHVTVEMLVCERDRLGDRKYVFLTEAGGGVGA